MKKQASHSALRLPAIILILSVLSVLTVSFLLRYGTQKKFQTLTWDLFREQLSQNTIDLHFTLAHPENYGITDYEVTLPCYSARKEEAQRLYLENLLDTLHSLQPKHLNEDDRLLLELLTHSLESSLTFSRFAYYEEPLSPSGGMHTQLPILLSEYTFRSLQDVEDYLALLEQTDEYFTSLLEYEKEKKQSGLLMAASSLDKTIDQCDTIVTKEDIVSGRHFLQTSFLHRLQELSRLIPISSKEMETYQERHNHILKNILIPAYQALADGLYLLRDEDIPLQGLGAYPEGADFYRQLLISRVGSYHSPEEIKDMYIRQMNRDYEAITKILRENPQVANALLRREYQQLPLTDTKKMLDDLRSRMETDFPSYLFSGEKEPTVILKDLDENLSDFCAPAFYYTVPLDDCDTNVIYINNPAVFPSLELYTTLAHEAFPGHLYQTVFHNRYQDRTKANPVQALLWYGGYLEGWALYVEFIAYDYAADMLMQEHRLADALCVELEKHNRSMQLCLYSLLDYMIHYENATPGELIPCLEPFGVTDMESIRAIYQYLIEDPCNYPLYYLGYLEICNLKEDAVAKWEKGYTDYRFHSFLLEQGPADFATLQKLLD
ncbi:MAG: DUF885 domain-containing protein [Lachnospiraceae bacterium]|nr:DUF885 domain-containing protein [Lachnospiraceae bacterium]